MFSIADLLLKAKEKSGIESDYRLAKILKISHQAIAAYRGGITLPKDKVIAQLCKLSGDDPHLVLALIQAARASSPEAKNLWESLVKRLTSVGAAAYMSVVFAISLVAGYQKDSNASTDYLKNYKVINNLYIVSNTIFLGVIYVLKTIAPRRLKFAAFV